MDKSNVKDLVTYVRVNHNEIVVKIIVVSDIYIFIVMVVIANVVNGYELEAGINHREIVNFNVVNSN